MPSPRKPALLDSIRRSRLCIFENENEIVLVSAATTATLVARIKDASRVEVAPGIPAFWLSERDRHAAIGSDRWDDALRKVGFTLVGTSHADWNEDALLQRLRSHFPTIEVSETIQ